MLLRIQKIYFILLCAVSVEMLPSFCDKMHLRRNGIKITDVDEETCIYFGLDVHDPAALAWSRQQRAYQDLEKTQKKMQIHQQKLAISEMYVSNACEFAEEYAQHLSTLPENHDERKLCSERMNIVCDIYRNTYLTLQSMRLEYLQKRQEENNEADLQKLQDQEERVQTSFNNFKTEVSKQIVEFEKEEQRELKKRLRAQHLHLKYCRNKIEKCSQEIIYFNYLKYIHFLSLQLWCADQSKIDEHNVLSEENC